MKKNNRSASQSKRIAGHLQKLVVAAFLVALSIICGKYLAIPVGTVMRFSFENLPLLLAGALFGPALGLMTAVAADLLGCVMVGYEINPLVTLGAAAIGLAGGILYRLLKGLHPFFRVLITVMSAHVIGSVLIKTVGLSVFYDLPFYLLLLWRLLNYVIVGTVEGVLLYYLLNNRALRHSLEKLR